MHTYPPLTADLSADVLVIGAGITGALLADSLSAAGLSTVLLDRRDVAFGSTSASTALLQYEIDTNLHELSCMIGQKEAERAYWLCAEAIDHVAELCAGLPDDCGFQKKGSLYFASGRRDARMLREEYAARTQAGFRVEWLDAKDLKTGFGLQAQAALLSQQGAEVDPYRLAQHLLWRSQERGVQIFDRTEVKRLDEERGGFVAYTDRGPKIQARHVVVASGYEAEQFLGRRLAALKNSYAFASEPLPESEQPWPIGCLVWETARPYIYTRTTADGRVIVGGEDDDFHSPARRERVLERKKGRLNRKLKKLFPALDIEPAFAWAGTFGETKDGLAYIGPKPGSKLLFALGYGGNGITYSVQAARMLTAHIQGRLTPDMSIFRLDR